MKSRFWKEIIGLDKAESAEINAWADVLIGTCLSSLKKPDEDIK